MAEIKEVIEDVKEKVGDKGFLLIIIGIAVLFIIMLFRESSEGGNNSTYIVPTGYTSYPDAVTNANVIIDEVNKNSDYNTESILDAMEDYKTSIDDQFSFTNDYMSEGFENIQSGMSGLNTSIGGIQSDMDALQGTVGSINSNVTNIKDTVGKIQSGVSNMNNNLGKIESVVTSNQSLLNNLKDKIGSSNASQSSGSVSSSNASSYYAKSSYTGVSIVDAFKSIGIYSIGGKDIGDWTSRTAIAKANGIDNYTGSASQNSKLLNLLKSGKLKKA